MGRLKRGLDRTLDGLMILLLAGIVVLVLLQISQRYFSLFPTPWTEEMSRYLFVYLTFFGSALLIKEKGHIIVDVVVDNLPRRLRLMVFVLVQLLLLAFLYLFVGGIFELTLTSSNTVASSMTWFSMSWLYGGVWLGGVLMFVYTLIELVKGVMELLGRREERV
ncbi:MAG: TRAP transporter small permease [Rubrobacter sp.]|jgi:TRAP-type C4-dicarboxylate transport system permease small subunit|nr:TRAP transporter small permease [Rubrobacter sp.]